VKSYAPSYGFGAIARLCRPASQEGDTVQFGNTTLHVFVSAGHPGHVGFYNREQKAIMSGDVLFEEASADDLPGGDFQYTLSKASIENFSTLPDDVVVYPGHGGTDDTG